MRAPLPASRRVLFWTHLALGLTGGVIILIMSITGVLLGFERQIAGAIDGVAQVKIPHGGRRLSLDSMMLRAGLELPAVASVALRTDADQPVRVRLRDRERGTLLLDPYRGTELQAPEPGDAAAFLSATRRWHRWMGATGGELRTQMRAITGAANLAFLLLVLSGLWLWWPKRWSWAALRNVLWFRRGLRPKARDFNWHNTIGFWSAIPLALVVASGVFISYRWPGEWLDAALGSPQEQQNVRQARAERAAPAERIAPEKRVAPEERAEQVSLPLASLDQFVHTATQAQPDWRSLTITLPDPGDSTANLAVAGGNTYRPDLRTTLVTRAADATLLESRGYGSLSRSRQIRAWVRFGHTGEVFGLPGQFIATLVSLGGAVLVWTGLALSWRRFRQWRRRVPATRFASTAQSASASADNALPAR